MLPFHRPMLAQSPRVRPHRVRCTALRVRPARRARGLTLVELLAALTITAILAAIAVPSLRAAVQRNGSWADTSTFHAALNRAHAEATRQGTAITLCASSDGTACGGSWGDGWILFRPTSRAALTTVGTVIEKQQALGSAIASSTAAASVTFEPTGRVSGGMTGGGYFTVTRSGTPVRTICLNVAGRTRVLQSGESSATCL